MRPSPACGPSRVWARNLISGDGTPANETLVTRGVALARLDAALTVLGATIPALAMAAVFWQGGLRVVSGDLTVGVLLAFGTWMVRLYSRSAGLVSRFTYFLRARVSAGRVNELLTVHPEIRDPARPVSLPKSGGELHFADVSVIFGERRVLDGVSLRVRPGEAVAVAGMSGAGKSLLLSLAPRLYDPQRGEVFLDGVNVRDLTLEELRLAVCLVSEDTMLLKDTVAANISLGRPEASLAQIDSAAGVAQARAFIMEMPDRYDSVIGERGLSLSGGQRQRIALARAVLVGSRVLLLDDASSSLDPATDLAIWHGLTRRGRGSSLLLATQRRRTAALADRVILLEAGRVAAEGTDAELWRTSSLYREVFSGGPSA